MKVIDCRGLDCPMPVINTKKYFESIDKGIANIIVDNEIAKNNLEKFSKTNSFDFSFEQKDKDYILNIEKKLSVDNKNQEESFVIMIASDKLGDGNDELGKTLMKTYLYALSESTDMPSKILFLNGGVKLVVEESNTLEVLKNIKEKDVEILSCGACLDFYGLKEKLGVGEITNMYTIVEEMNLAKKFIKL